jgi:hypothetical protein
MNFTTLALALAGVILAAVYLMRRRGRLRKGG